MLRRFYYFILYYLLLVVMLAACGANLVGIDTPTAIPSSPPTLSPTEAFTPLPSPTSVLSLSPAISRANASQVTELLRLSNGIVQHSTWLPDGKQLLVATTVGVYLYDATTGTELRYFATAPSPSIAVDPTGKLLATGEGRDVRIWDLATGQEQRTLHIDGENVQCIVFSPNLHTLAVETLVQPSQGEGGIPELTAVQVWDLDRDELLYSLLARQRPMFSPDGRLLAVYYNEEIELFDLAGQLWNTIPGHWDFIFSSDGHYIASQVMKDVSSAENLIELRDTDSWQVRCQFAETDFFGRMSFSADEKKFAASGSAGSAEVWDTSTCQPLYSITGHEGYVDLAFNPKNDVLASYGRLDRTVQLWDSASGTHLSTLTGFYGDLGDFSPDGKWLTENRWFQGTISLWDWHTGKTALTLEKHTPHVGSLSFSPDERILAGGHAYGGIYLWSLDTAQIQGKLYDYNSFVSDLAFSPDGKILAASDTDAKIELWDVKSGQHLLTLEGHNKDKWVTKIAFSPDGRTLASQGTDQTVRLWDLKSGQVRFIFVLVGNDSETTMSFSPDGQTIAIATSDKRISRWDAKNGQFLSNLIVPTDLENVTKLAFSQSGDLLVAAGYQTIWLWDMNTQKLLTILKNAGNNIGSIALSPDEKILAVSGWTGIDKLYEIKLWDINSGELLVALPGHTDWIPKLVFSPSGRFLASASADGTVRLWGIKH